MKPIVLDARKLQPARLITPPSKSDALRLLVLASRLDRPDWVKAIGRRPWASDIEHLAVGLKALGHGPVAPDRVEVIEIDCGDGAAPLRMLLALSAIQRGRFRFTGSRRLGQRSHAALLSALHESLSGAGLILKQGDPWPIEIDATGETGAARFCVSGAGSSQPASSLALAAGVLSLRERRAWTVDIEGGLVSEGYLELTLHAMRQAGFLVERTGFRLEFLGWDAARCHRPDLPVDWSAAAFLLPIAWRIGGSVTGLDLAAPHPDRAIVGLLESIGLKVSHSDGETRITGRASRGLTTSGRESPDLIPALVALACALPGPSLFTALATLRDKESDRLAGAEALAEAAGARAKREADTLQIEPAAEPPGLLRFDACNDHRMIMAAATLAVLLGARLELGGAAGVEKSFPGFFGQLQIAGVELC